MDHRCFQRLHRRKWRHDPRNPRRQHGFAGPGRADHQDMVPPGGGDFQRPFRPFLPFDIAQIPRAGVQPHFARQRRRNGLLAGVMPDHLGQRGCPDNLGRPDPGCLGPASLGAEQHPFFLGRTHRRWQCPDHRDQFAAERELAQSHSSFNLVQWQDVERREQRQSDRQVEMRPLFG